MGLVCGRVEGMKDDAKLEKIWDVVVIGGGPAGMMAAIQAAIKGASVILLEKNSGLGKKLLITGGGRCNVTNAEPELRKLVGRYKGSDQFLFSAFSQYDNQGALAWFHSQGMPTKVENEGRVFPASNTARSVWEVLVREMEKSGVAVRLNSAVQELVSDQRGLITSARLVDGSEVAGRSFIVAAGGSARPETGSTGDAWAWLKQLGHTIIPVSRALVPIAIKDKWVKKLAGLTLPDIKLTIVLDGKREGSRKGKLLFTHVGVTGPTVLNMSRSIGEMLPYGDVTLLLDLLPASDHGGVKEKLYEILNKESNKKLKNSLAMLVPVALVQVLLEIAGIDGEQFSHSVKREERVALVALLKAVPLRVQGLLGEDKAVVSSGGVALGEVDFKTMRSRLVPNLYIVGDVLNVDRPSGGYSLQLCWTTGFVAGASSWSEK
ncbi:MAG: aminoacetone oxidase family FAD-binding enzyme [Candidatus Harrisonbacteria bacterium CG10_big_fil_rev_8_21_14_0_10_49_15]|uniref:Aminoacetone oxidase family FAD-binding enzyme n=1 Tax=Candidatus Harrisonbacteria bacterium CG10_big_fil_rev_8_21_14_0_10_49_15 TaxID=1974587 RepID=A0A2H0UKQ6_9BACT|nr:MAG: aminoacetone oxidase family FAD-binding enzyme [Candidatus Harrisonbacteria bacterium CG10_big_fil_rev_8_21_14_0_10_49_15]